MPASPHPIGKGNELVVVIDTLVAGVHFPDDTQPVDIGFKALAVNLSDLAAMGAVPTAARVILTLPDENESWLTAFEAGCRELAHRYAMTLESPTTIRGSLCVTVEALGEIPRGMALTRSGARPGDTVYVTGTLGDAGLALAARAGDLTIPSKTRTLVEKRLARPEPRIEAGLALRDIASAAIDISDGLCADLGHVLAASKVGATVSATELPLSKSLRESVAMERAWRLALASGDDYELCFTVPPERVSSLKTHMRDADCSYSRVGTVKEGSGLQVLGAHGHDFDVGPGYRHFQ